MKLPKLLLPMPTSLTMDAIVLVFSLMGSVRFILVLKEWFYESLLCLSNNFGKRSLPPI